MTDSGLIKTVAPIKRSVTLTLYEIEKTLFKITSFKTARMLRCQTQHSITPSVAIAEHILAATKHHVIDKDNVLLSMLRQPK